MQACDRQAVERLTIMLPTFATALGWPHMAVPCSLLEYSWQVVSLSSDKAPLLFVLHAQAALRWPKEHTIKLGRQNVWMMLGNITVNPADDPTCWQDRELLFPTQLYGQRLHGNASGGVSAHNLADQTLPLGPGTARSGEGSSVVEGNSAGHAGPLDDKFALGFSFMQSALRLPEGVDDKFLQIQNMTLLQLPQGPYTAGAANLAAGQDGPTPPDVWTFLLWSIGR